MLKDSVVSLKKLFSKNDLLGFGLAKQHVKDTVGLESMFPITIENTLIPTELNRAPLQGSRYSIQITFKEIILWNVKISLFLRQRVKDAHS